MGRACKTKRPGKLGKGLVTPIQVAFIVDRYLLDNNYTQTLSVFRSEASALLSMSKLREAPKSLLSLGDILNEYISLKEQKVFLEQEKCRVEKLLQGMQEVMTVYQSSDTSTEIPSHQKPVLQSPRNNPVVTNSTPTSTNTPSPSSKESFIPTVHSNTKRKVSGTVLQPTPSTKKSFNHSSTYPPNGAVGTSAANQISHDSIHPRTQSSTGYSMVQPASETNPHYISPMQELPIASGIVNQLSSTGCASPSPKTPPQQSATQTGSSHSPVGAASSSPLVSSSLSDVVQFSESSLEVTTTDQQFCSSSANENLEYCLSYDMCEDGQQQPGFSPSKFVAKKSGKGEHVVKGRLDFDDSGILMSSVRRCEEASLPTFEAEAGASFNIDDVLDFSILDSDVSLSYLVDFVMDSHVTDFLDHSTPCQATNHTSSLCSERDQHLDIDGAFVDLPLTERMDVLCEKDLNCQANDNQNISKSTTPCTKTNSPGRKKRRISSDQENVPTA